MASRSGLVDTVEWSINIDYSDQSQRKARHGLVGMGSHLKELSCAVLLCLGRLLTFSLTRIFSWPRRTFNDNGANPVDAEIHTT